MTKLYSKLAKYYNLIYEKKDYGRESKELYKIIKKYKKSRGTNLLDVACGTGTHLAYLRKKYHVVGLDINKAMLRIAKKLCPNLKFIQANMVSFNLHKKFDIILCLFSSIGYVKTYKNLKRALNCFARHLKPGGIVLIEPFFTEKQFKVGTLYANFVDLPKIKIARFQVSEKKGNVTVLKFHYLIATKEGVNYYKDKHELGLFEVKRFLKIMRDAGLKAKFLKNGARRKRGLYVGIKE